MSTVTVCSVHALMVLVLFCLSFDNSTKLTRSKTKLLKLRSLLCVVPPPPATRPVEATCPERYKADLLSEMLSTLFFICL